MELTYRHIYIAVSTILTLGSLGQSKRNCESNDEKCFRITALVPARAGSKGIKDKNLSVLGNETLIERTLRIINETDKFDAIWVSTDGKNIADVATKQGAQVHWRDPKTATDNASTVSAVEDFLHSRNESDIIAVVQCTSPFIQSKFLREAVDYITGTDVDCVFSVTRSHKLRWITNQDGFVTPLNFNPQKRPRRQDWEGEFVENGMFYIVRTKLVLENKSLQNDRCKIIEIPPRYSMEIDTKFDLTLARFILSLPEKDFEN